MSEIAPNVSQANVCLLSCFMPVNSEVRDWLNELSSALAKHRLQLVVLASEVREALDIPVIIMPHTLRAVAEWPLPEAAVQSVWTRDALRLAVRDQAWVGGGASDLQIHLEGYTRCEWVLRRVLRALRPAVVLTWGSTLPPSVLLRQLCNDFQIPALSLERGLLPGTLMTDVLGHGSRSDLNATLLGESLLSNAAGDERFEAACAYYCGHRRSKYAQGETLTRDEFTRRYNSDGRQVLAFFGQYDHGCGMFPADCIAAGTESPFFESTYECLKALSEAVAHIPNCRVVFKPHPLDTSDYTTLENDTTTTARGSNIYDLFSYADVYAFTLSATQFEALLYEKPTVLLARSALASRGIAYEPETRDQLVEVLEAAFQRNGMEMRRARQRGFVSALLNHYLVRTRPGVPASLDLPAFATFLARNAAAPLEPLAVGQALSSLAGDIPRLGILGIPVPAHDEQLQSDSKSSALEMKLLQAALRERDQRIIQLNQTARERLKAVDDISSVARERQQTIEQLNGLLRERVEMSHTRPVTPCNDSADESSAEKLGHGHDPLPSEVHGQECLDRENADDWDKVGEQAWQEGKQDEACRAFTKAAALQPMNADRWIKLGMVYRLIDRIQDSATALDRAVQLAPTHAGALRELAITRMMQGRWADALPLLIVIKDDGEARVQRLLLVARCRYEGRDYLGAMRDYRSVLELEPANADAQECIRLIEQDMPEVLLSRTEVALRAARQAEPLAPTPEMLQCEYPCPQPFQQLYVVPRGNLDIRFCSHHSAVLLDEQKRVYDGGLAAWDLLQNGHPELARKRRRFLDGDFKGAGCSENCLWYAKWKTTGKGYRLADYLGADGKFKLRKMWLSMGPDCNVRCRYCLEVDEFKMDFNTCDPKVMNIARDFVRRGGELLLTGGETFLPKWGFARALEQLIEWGDTQGTISLHTNGTYLNAKNRDLLLRGPVTSVGVSMDTLRKGLFEYLRRGTSYDLVWGNVTSLLEEKNGRGLKRPSIILLCAVLRSTADHIVETVDRAVDAGLGISLNALFQSYYSPTFSEREGLHHLSADELKKLYDDVLKIEAKYGPSGPVHYQGFKGQVHNQLNLLQSHQGQKQVVLGGGGQSPRLPHFGAVELAEIELRRQNFSAAEQAIAPTLKRLNRSARAQRVWAMVLMGLHRDAEAVEAWKRVLALDSMDEAAQRELETLQARMHGAEFSNGLVSAPRDSVVAISETAPDA